MRKYILLLCLLFWPSVYSLTVPQKLDTKLTLNKNIQVETLNIAKGGVLTLAAGRSLTVTKGIDVVGQLIMKEGSSLVLNFSKAGSLNILPGGLLKVEGSSKKPCQVLVQAGSAVAYISDGGQRDGGRIVASYCHFKNLGGKPGYKAYQYSPNETTGPIVLEDCVFDSCYQLKVNFGALQQGAKVSFIRCKWRNSQVKPVSERGQYEEWYIYDTSAQVGSEAKLIACDFDKMVAVFHSHDYVIEDCIFREGVKIYSHWHGAWKSFKRNFIRSISSTEEFNISFGSKVEDCIFVKDCNGWNPHYITVGGKHGDGGIYGSVFWFTGPGEKQTRAAEGDGIMVGAAASGTREQNTFTIERNIILPNKFGPNKSNSLSTTLLTILGKSLNSQVVVKRNTVYVCGNNGLNIGETNPCTKGHLAYVKSNLFFGPGSGFKIHNLGHTVTDAISGQDVDYNSSWNIGQGSNFEHNSGKGYNHLQFSKATTLGAHDIDDLNPGFVDINRTPFSWDTSLGGQGNMASMMNRLSATEAGVFELLKYIRDGFRPTNNKLKSAGDPKDGSPDIGAVNLK